jgi:membrane protein implicated in regulation of membrane protease activity
MQDPQSIWKNQPTEAFKMKADELRRKMQQQQRKARFKVIFAIIIGLFLFVVFGRGAFTAHGDAFPRLGFGVLSLWSIYFAYQEYKWIWPGRLAADAAFNNTLQSYRGELEKRRDYGRHIWRRAGLSFCFFGLALVVVPGLVEAFNHPGLLMNFVPIFALLVTWLAAFFYIRKRQRQKLQQEIEELGALETEAKRV